MDLVDDLESLHLTPLRKSRSAEASTYDLSTTKFIYESLRRESLRRSASTPIPYLSSSPIIHDARKLTTETTGIQTCTNPEVIALFQRAKYLLLNEAVYVAFSTAGLELTSRIKEVLEQQWPLIIIGYRSREAASAMGGCHTTLKNSKENNIYIDSELINCFEAANKNEKEGLTLFLFAVLIHELSHYLGTRIFGLEYNDTPELSGRKIGPAEAGEKAEAAIFGGVILVNRINQYELVIADENEAFDPLKTSELAHRFWSHEMRVPFISEEYLDYDDLCKTRTKGAFARARGYEKVIELARRQARKKLKRKVTESYSGPGSKQKDVIR